MSFRFSLNFSNLRGCFLIVAVVEHKRTEVTSLSLTTHEGNYVKTTSHYSPTVFNVLIINLFNVSDGPLGFSHYYLISFLFIVPPKFETIMEDVDIHVGETCRLAVVVEGKPDPDILWYKVRWLTA